MVRFLALLGIVVMVLLSVFFARTRPAGTTPDQQQAGVALPTESTEPPLRLSTVEDLARLTPEELTRLAEGKVEVDEQNVASLGTDVGQRLEDVSLTLRELDLNFHVPPVRGRTSSTGASGRGAPRPTARQGEANAGRGVETPK
ncbi:MAG TPA: hypothetical protein VF701_19080 [Thermoanaerobaculia bacterium]